jgi:integrase
MPHIEKLDNGKYKAIVEVGAGERRKRRTKTFERKKDAKSWQANMLVDQEKGRYVSSASLTVADHMLDWLDNEKKPHIATTTYDNYKNRIKTYIIPEIGYIPLQELEPFHISRFMGYLRKNGSVRNDGGLSENTLKKIYVVLNSAMEKAVQWRLIKYNPVQAIESPQPKKKEAKSMSFEEVQKLLDSVNDKFMHTFFSFAVLTGMRKSEMLGLEWSEVDLENETVEVKKRLVVNQNSDQGIEHEEATKREASRRIIAISSKLAKLLKSYKAYQAELRLQLAEEYNDQKEFVFCKPDGNHYYPPTITRKAKKAILIAGLSSEYSLHTLRHTFATLQLKNGTDAKVIQEMLGHGNISTTMDIYSHVDIDMQKEAAKKLENEIVI